MNTEDKTYKNELVRSGKCISKDFVLLVQYDPVRFVGTYYVYPVLHTGSALGDYAPILKAPLHAKTITGVRSMQEFREALHERMRKSFAVPMPLDSNVVEYTWNGTPIAVATWDSASLSHSMLTFGNNGHFVYSSLALDGMPIDAPKVVYKEAYSEGACKCILPTEDMYYFNR